jgi:hypothetical protein
LPTVACDDVLVYKNRFVAETADLANDLRL